MKVSVYNNGENLPFAVFTYITEMRNEDGWLYLYREDKSKGITIIVDDYAWLHTEND